METTITIQQKAFRLIKGGIFLTILYTLFYLYQLNAPNLGQPLRRDCSSTNNISLDQMNQTKVFLGIFSTPEKYARRQMIRDTYLQSKPTNMVYKFVLGSMSDTTTEQQATLELEIKQYDDILILGMDKENMNQGKTFEFFRTVAGETITKYHKGIDFVLKADDDAYLYLNRVQFDLAHTARHMTYWGYLVGNTFMAGECYGLSMDLVQWISHAEIPRRYKNGHEDSQVQKWFQWAHINHEIKYEVRNCRIHDHKEAGSVYAREIDLDSSMVVHYLKKDHFFMRTHDTFTSLLYQQRKNVTSFISQQTTTTTVQDRTFVK
ncbi:hypothetical protein BD770DRAFT_471534 [Pilaira anomala]|nr:hypothetical protein BD770DRAFT_471534 [Pilaira anomala]